MSYTYHLKAEWPDGHTQGDHATGNTERAAYAAAMGLGRQYALDGAHVTVKRGRAITVIPAATEDDTPTVTDPRDRPRTWGALDS